MLFGDVLWVEGAGVIVDWEDGEDGDEWDACGVI